MARTIHLFLVTIMAMSAITRAGADLMEARPGGTCLLFSAENIVKGDGNWYTYIEVSDAAYTFQPGDKLEYDILLPALNPLLKGGVDADLKREGLPQPLASRPWVRDCGIQDQNGILLHGDGVLEPAKDKWYHRVFDLAPVVGCTTSRWTVVFEGDKPGRYVQLLDNIRVTRDGRTVLSIYEDGSAPAVKLRQTEGYSRTVFVTSVPREDALSDATVAEFLEKARRENQAREARDQFRAELDVARQLAARENDQKLIAEIDAAAKEEDAAALEAGRMDEYLESLHRARHRLGHAHPKMQQYTGHLVGHAHIDLQWLWSWDETVQQIIPQTFGQAVKFMREFPEFTFSQSSPALYLATEQHHPALFEEIQEMVAKGQWEIVGGRWCEGDTNMISPESHVRHLLYGQRYFQQKFGRMATVGWEPDTFGHTWQLPQILRKAGIDSYYFCRGADHAASPARDVPLFWWESPDGSRVLAFQEPATGGWYNDVVNDEKVRELAKFVGGVNGLDHLMVYGVGNHGGGPTREYIEAALAMLKRGLWPRIRFSTASEFFRRLHEQAASGVLKVPPIRDEINPIFEGCYTTHGRIKKYNRDCESLLESAEVWATLAAVPARSGAVPPGVAGGPFVYPRAEFEALWRDVLWSHHHDTLPGSFIHPSALYSYKLYDAVIERGTEILEAARGRFVDPRPLEGAPSHIVVFNPLAWTRSEVVEVDLRVPVTGRLTALCDSDGDVPMQVVDRRIDGDAVSLRVAFRARNVPACGYKVFRNRGPASASPELVTSGNLDQVYPLTRGNYFVPPVVDCARARLQVLWEKPHGMSAWTVGEFSRVTDLSADDEHEILENGRVRSRMRQTYRYDKSTITQDIVQYPDSNRVDYETTIDWRQTGSAKDGGPMLKVGFDSGVRSQSAVYEVAFGDITRNTDGHENVALKWLAAPCQSVNDTAHRNSSGTVAILNDCKHAYDVKEGAIRLTLVRSSYEPDPEPDLGLHLIRYAVLTLDGPLDRAAVTRAAWEFNKPLQAIVIGFATKPRSHEATKGPEPRAQASDQSEPRALASDPVGSESPGVADLKSESSTLKSSWSGLSAEPGNIIITALKLAEDNDDVILRAYECAGRPADAVFTLGFDVKSAVETDLLERDWKDARPVTLDGRSRRADFKPYEIRTFRLRR
jgi:alpha-mannosidase